MKMNVVKFLLQEYRIDTKAGFPKGAWWAMVHPNICHNKVLATKQLVL